MRTRSRFIVIVSLLFGVLMGPPQKGDGQEAGSRSLVIENASVIYMTRAMQPELASVWVRNGQI